jgi:hypothetical protein
MGNSNVEKKICIKCEEEKDIDEFYEDKRRKDGYENICMDCAQKHLELSSIYIIEANGCYKIGESKHPKKRLKQLQTGNHCYLAINRIYENIQYATKIEKILHTKLEPYHLEGEWFKCDINKIYDIIDKTLSELSVYNAWDNYKYKSKYEKQYLKKSREFNLWYRTKRQIEYEDALNGINNNVKQQTCIHCNSTRIDVARDNTKMAYNLSKSDIEHRTSTFYCLDCKRYFNIHWENLL